MLAANQLGQDHNNNNDGQVDGDGGVLLKNFITLQLPKFHRRLDVFEVENWLASMEKHLRTMGYTDAQNVHLSIFLL